MHTLADIFSQPVSDDFKQLVAIVGAFAIPLVAIIGGLFHTTARTKAREQTKRELAAYVAEGSMKPEDAERIINAGSKGGKCC